MIINALIPGGLYLEKAITDSVTCIIVDTIGHDGFCVNLGMGAAFLLSVYYTVINDLPIFLAYANFAEEIDLDGDGDKELVNNSHSILPTCSIIKSFDGVVMQSADIQKMLSQNDLEKMVGVIFDPEKQLFNAIWYTDNVDGQNTYSHETEYKYSDKALVEVCSDNSAVISEQ